MIFGNILRPCKTQEYMTLDNEKFGMSANFQYEEALKELETFLYQEGTN